MVLRAAAAGGPTLSLLLLRLCCFSCRIRCRRGIFVAVSRILFPSLKQASRYTFIATCVSFYVPSLIFFLFFELVLSISGFLWLLVVVAAGQQQQFFFFLPKKLVTKVFWRSCIAFSVFFFFFFGP